MQLNPSQQAAVNSTAARLVVTAAAGSGKTRVYVERIRRMIADGADPRSIIAVTFTNAGAKEIQERLALKNYGPDDLPSHELGYCGTLHGFVLRILQQHGNIIGLPQRLTVIDESEADAIRQDTILKLSYKGTRKAVDAEIGKGVDHFRGSCYKPGTDAERVSFEYYFRLLTTGCLTFNCILELGLELIKKLADQNIGQYQNIRQFEHLMVDECNDSASIDFEIYEALPVKTRFYCGDRRQKIYGFRGSCNGFGQLIDGAPANKWTALELAENYRSGTAIICAANKLQPQFSPMICATGTVGNFNVTAFDTAAEEAADTAAWIKKKIQENTPPTEIAVLCRTNALVGAFKKTLTDSGIPVRARKQADNPLDWTTARAFIALLTNPENDRLAYKFTELKCGTEKAGQMQRAATANFETINERYWQIGRHTLETVTSAMVGVGLERESVGRVRQIIESLQPTASILELQAAIVAQTEAQAEEGDGVTVTTIHGAKGREWAITFLPAWEEGVFPSAREAADEEQLAESRRLAYVAVTRAKSLCAISFARRREQKWKGMQKMLPSRFIGEATGGQL